MSEKNEARQIKEFMETVGKGRMNCIDIARRVLADGKEHVEFSLVNKPADPQRAESPRRAHVFQDAASFCEYVNANISDKGTVLVDMTNHVAEAVLDESSREGFEIVAFLPAQDPAFAMLQNTLLDKAPMEIARFARRLLRNRNILAGTPEQNMQLAMMLQQINISEKTVIKTGVGKKSTNGVMTYSEVKAGYEDEGTQMEIPDAIPVITPIYLHTDPVEFEMIITVSKEQNGQVIVVIDTPELDKRRNEIFEKLLAELGGSIKAYVGCGEVRFKEWGYVDYI